MVKNVEANFSGDCLHNYLEYVDELPVDISRIASKLRELDVKCKGYLDEADNLNRQKESLADETEKAFAAKETKRLLEKIVQALKNFQDSVDEKIRFTHLMSESIDIRNRHLDSDFSNLGLLKKDEPLADISNIKQEREHQVISPVSVVAQQVFTTSPVKTPSGDNIANIPTTSATNASANNKRARRARADTVSMDVDEIPIKSESPPIVTKPVVQTIPTANTAQKKAAAASGAGGKKKKRKAGRQANAQATTNNQVTLREQVADALPIDPEAIDPEEPTYCLCEQISFGEMILCDNDLCPIEWFHFSCVSLMTKPKGKWFCPNCRGDRVNCMKPKAQFLKELRKYEMRQEIN